VHLLVSELYTSQMNVVRRQDTRILQTYSGLNRETWLRDNNSNCNY